MGVALPIRREGADIQYPRGSGLAARGLTKKRGGNASESGKIKGAFMEGMLPFRKALLEFRYHVKGRKIRKKGLCAHRRGGSRLRASVAGSSARKKI